MTPDQINGKVSFLLSDLAFVLGASFANSSETGKYSFVVDHIYEQEHYRSHNKCARNIEDGMLLKEHCGKYYRDTKDKRSIAHKSVLA